MTSFVGGGGQVGTPSPRQLTRKHRPKSPYTAGGLASRSFLTNTNTDAFRRRGIHATKTPLHSAPRPRSPGQTPKGRQPAILPQKGVRAGTRPRLRLPGALSRPCGFPPRKAHTVRGQDGRQGRARHAPAATRPLLCGRTLSRGRVWPPGHFLQGTFSRLWGQPSGPGPRGPQTRADPPETPAGQVHDSPEFPPLPGLQGPLFRACSRRPPTGAQGCPSGGALSSERR